MKNRCRILKVIGSINFAVIFSLIIFSGCATKDAVRNLSDEDVLRERVVAYWGHKVNREFVKAYEYEYNPEHKTLERYVLMHSNPAIGFKSFNVESIVINKEDGSADVGLTIVPSLKVPGVRPFEIPKTITERWVRVKESWYHVK